ncbi:MAG TPA: flagellar motor protein [Dehalococcoidia bacterium]
MDIATLIGFVVGLGAIIGSTILEGGTPAALINAPAALIVFGGTIGAALISFPLKRIMAVPKAVVNAFTERGHDADEVVSHFVTMADRARREGLLSLEEEGQRIDDPFLRKGILLMIDGTDPELLRSILEIDIDALEKRHEESFGILEAAGGYAPTMGIIGTVMGLINVLSHLEDPSNLGHSIAVAFIATFYGVFSANIIWLPLANKLKKKSEEERRMREVMLEGIMSIQAGDNPRIVQEKLEGFLPPSMRGRDRRRGREDAPVGETEQAAA